ncbi:RNB-like protein, putative [Babesia bigemina]|uniref:RNB-like protein, putative n=1 Tax=Babesia bigemina TaxID=5866 RepID=A0A061DCR9_BABBI|nr:RNB-like protein, putative [Babesia bigemina]CDR95730.1 RNB-like protein, putative [Babesia bigemina]|eukprot:XP_012767916.1 RNB-like protein, putative [Babesia bigemina]
MALAALPARVALSAYTRFLSFAQYRHRCVDAIATHRCWKTDARVAGDYPKVKRREGKKQSSDAKAETAPRRRSVAVPPKPPKHISQPKTAAIAYETYWEESSIQELEAKHPELVVRGTVVIPAFATNEAKVARHATRTDNAGGSDLNSDPPSTENDSAVSGSAKRQRIDRSPLCDEDGGHAAVTESQDSSPSVTREGTAAEAGSDDTGTSQTADTADVRIFGFIARNRAFHGDEVVAVRQRRLRQQPATHDDTQLMEQQCRVVRIVKRSPALESFVGVMDANACLNATDATFKCQPQDTRWPAFNVRRDQMDSEMLEQVQQLREKGKIFCLMQFNEWHEHDMEPSGRVVRIIGSTADPSARMHATMIFHGLNPSGFSDEVLDNLKELIKSGEGMKEANRVDKRDITVFTIDPQDAKDLDDALSVETVRDEKGNYRYKVGVHIADVSHYVKEGSAVDMDARQRATSVYLEHKVFPMLPQMLSENMCSLLPHSEKLCFSVFAELSEDPSDGEMVGNNLYIRNQEFILTRIISCERLSYQTAKEIIDSEMRNRAGATDANLASMPIAQFEKRYIEDKLVNDTSVVSADAAITDDPAKGNCHGESSQEVPEASATPNSLMNINRHVFKPLMTLYFISRKLRHFRLKQRGAVMVDTNGSCKCHIPRVGEKTERLWVEQIPRESHELVEEMMLLANTQAAQLLAKSFDNYFLRVHENTSRAIKQLVVSVMPQDLKSVLNPEILPIPELLRKCAKHMEPTAFQSLSFAALQQFKEAVYSPVNKDCTTAQGVTGHWGLALPMYLHFTSPIRRYSDLYTHRMLKTVIDGTYTEQSLKVLDDICKQCNLQKRKAFDVQKEYKNFAFNQYLQWACTSEGSAPPYAAGDSMFAKAFPPDGNDIWGMLYDHACVFSIVINGATTEDAKNKTSIIFYIPLLNEQRSVSCDSLSVTPLEAVVCGETVSLEGTQNTGDSESMVDGYFKEVQNAGTKRKADDARVESLTVLKGGSKVRMAQYDKVQVVLVPGSAMWTVRLSRDEPCGE